MGFWRRMFGRNSPPSIIDKRNMNEDWKAGDLAVCINDQWFPGGANEPRIGDVGRVASVHEGTMPMKAGGVGRFYLLVLVGKGGEWETTGFRKAEEDAEPCEADFKQLVKRPVRQKEPSDA